MNTTTLLKECEARNITLRVVNDRLHYRAPKGALNNELKKRLKDFKPELIKTLSAELPANYYDKHIEAAIAEFNSRHITYTDIPLTKRRKAERLEKEMTAAANRGDRGTFLEALKQWRACFH